MQRFESPLVFVLLGGLLSLAGCESGGNNQQSDAANSGPDTSAEESEDTGGDTRGDTSSADEDTSTVTDTEQQEDTGGCLTGVSGGSGELVKLRDLSGAFALHPATSALDSEANVKDGRFHVTSMGRLISQSFRPLTQKQQLGEEAFECVPAQKSFAMEQPGGMWSFESVNVAPVFALGGTALMGVAGNAPDDSQKFTTTISPLATPDSLEEAEEVDGLTGFAVTSNTVDTIASITPQSKTELMEQGLAIGFVVNAEKEPVSGVKVGQFDPEQGVVAPLDRAMYPDAMFSEVTPGAEGGATSANGVVLIPGIPPGPYAGTVTSDGALATQPIVGFTIPQTVYALPILYTAGSNGGGDTGVGDTGNGDTGLDTTTSADAG